MDENKSWRPWFKRRIAALRNPALANMRATAIAGLHDAITRTPRARLIPDPNGYFDA